jgi:hypothetical protein
MSNRIYPLSRAASVIVWLLDRLPQSVRSDVLGSYWSHSDIEAVERRRRELVLSFDFSDPTDTKRIEK